MLRLQHYVEACYIVFAAFVLFDATRMVKWKMCPKPRDVARAVGFLAISPLVALYLAAKFVRDEW
jgi:hypothetical protein